MTNERSLIKDVVSRLVITISVVSIIIIGGAYFVALKRSENDFKKKIVEYTNYLEDALELPLWNFDDQGVRKITTSFFNNSFVASIVVRDSDGRPVVALEKESEQTPLIKNVLIFHRNRRVGAVEIGFTSDIYAQKNREFIITSLIYISLLVLAVLVSASYVLRYHLIKPIEYLVHVTDHIARGEYDWTLQEYDQREVRNIVARFEESARKVEQRELSLQEVNAHLKQEIADRLRAEGELELYRLIVATSKDLMAFADVNGIYRAVNEAYIEAHGKKREEIIGQPVSCLLEEEVFNETVKPRLERCLAGETVQFETWLHFKGWGDKYMQITYYPYWGPDGVVTGVVLNCRDVTTTKQLEADLIQARKMEAIGTLAAGIAHDFNNILQAISGNLELLGNGLGEEADTKSYVQKIDVSVERAANLVRRLLTVGRKAEPGMKPTDLKKEIKGSMEMLGQTIPRMVRVDVSISDDLKFVSADTTQLHLLLMNLGANAVDAMPDGGVLTIQAENVFLDEAFCRNHIDARPGDYIHLMCRDTGLGMDEETRKRMFDPFYTTKEVGKGTGLGLFMVYSIVRNHDGLLLFESAPGQGTVFDIYLPALDIEELEEGDVSVARQIRPGNENILVVDDEEQVMEVARDCLALHNYRVVTAGTGEEAVAALKNGGPKVDLVILDLNMPGMGGYKALKKMRAIDPDLKVIIASGYSESGEVARAMEAGAADFLGKPYRLEQLLAKVREVLDRG